jgi:hypothetical protein
MTYEDNLSGRIECERIDRLAEWLEATIGPRLTAFATATTATEVGRIAHGDEAPPDELEQRLRNLYAVVRLLTQRDRTDTPNEWLTAPNPELENRTPVELLREGESPAPVWFAASPTF